MHFTLSINPGNKLELPYCIAANNFMLRRNGFDLVIIHKIKKFDPYFAVSFILFNCINNLVGNGSVRLSSGI